MIQQTTLEAWNSIQANMNKRQAEVYAAIRVMGGATNLQVSRFLGLPINSVTPRVQELRKLGEIQEGEIVIQETGRSAIRWVVI
jgi:DNA-binding MarR family transcriptional regulator